MPGYDFDSPTIEVEGTGGGNTVFTVPNAGGVTTAFVPGQVLTIVTTTSTTVEVEGDHTGEERVFLLSDDEYATLEAATVGRVGAGFGVVAPESAGVVYHDAAYSSVGLYNSGGGYTAWSYPGNPADVNSVVLESGAALTPTTPGTGEVRVTGNYDGATAFLGIAYAMTLDLPRPATRGEDGVAELIEGLNYGRMVVSDQFGAYTLTALHDYRAPKVWTRAWSSKPGKLVAGTLRGLADRTVLRLASTGTRPCRIVAAESDATRTRRII